MSRLLHFQYEPPDSCSIYDTKREKPDKRVMISGLVNSREWVCDGVKWLGSCFEGKYNGQTRKWRPLPELGPGLAAIKTA
jgi:hypothetical protein